MDDRALGWRALPAIQKLKGIHIIMRTSIRLLTIQLCIFISACSLLPEDEKGFQSSTQSMGYMKIQDAEAFKVPESLSTPAFGDIYPVPRASTSLGQVEQARKFKLPQPKPLEIIWEDQKVQLRKKGARQWIRLNVKPGQAWGVLHQYLRHKNLPVEKEDSRAGTIASDWLTPAQANVLFSEIKSAKTAHRKLRIRVERGSDADISNVYLSLVEHKAAPVSQLPSDKEIDWTNTEAMLPQVNHLLMGLNVYLSNQDFDQSNVSLVGQTISSDPIAEITWIDGKAALKLRQDFNYGWKKVGLALKKGGFTIEDRNRSEGVYFLRFADEQGKAKGVYKRLRKNSELDTEALGSGLVRLEVQSEGRATYVSLNSDTDAVLSSGLQQAVLNRVKDNLE
ncbi:MAG: outer membrane protein assembly factor BamC [Gammaproteobacteria bacterium]|nr:outer membrane protein assembly factor BamC [Gammaproteobacteria bacterium]